MTSTSTAVQTLLQQSANISQFSSFEEIRDFIKSFTTLLAKTSGFTKILAAVSSTSITTTNTAETTAIKKKTSTASPTLSLDVIVFKLAQQIVNVQQQQQTSSPSSSPIDAETVARSWFSLITVLCQPIDEKQQELTENAKSLLSSTPKVRDAFCLFFGPRDLSSSPSSSAFITSSKSASDYCNALGFLIAQNDQAKKKIFGPSEKFQASFVSLGCSAHVTSSPEASDAWLRCFCKLLANNSINVKGFYGQSLRVREALCGIALSRKAVANEGVARWWCTAISNLVSGDRSKYILLSGKPFPRQSTMKEVVKEDEEKMRKADAKKHGYTLQQQQQQQQSTTTMASTSTSDFGNMATTTSSSFFAPPTQQKNNKTGAASAQEVATTTTIDFNLVVNDKVASANIARCFCDIARYIQGDEAAEWFCKAICKLTVDATFDDEKEVETEEMKLEVKKQKQLSSKKKPSPQQQEEEEEQSSSTSTTTKPNATSSDETGNDQQQQQGEQKQQEEVEIQQTNPFVISALNIALRTSWQSYKQQVEQSMRFAASQGNKAAAAKIAPPSIRVTGSDLSNHFVKFASALAVDEMAAAFVLVGRQIKTAPPIHFFCEAILRLLSIEKSWLNCKEIFAKENNNENSQVQNFGPQFETDDNNTNTEARDGSMRKPFTTIGDMFSTIEVRTTMVALHRIVVIAAAKEELERKKAKRKEKQAQRQKDKEEKEKLKQQVVVKNNTKNTDDDDQNNTNNNDEDDENNNNNENVDDDEHEEEVFESSPSNLEFIRTSTSTSKFTNKNNSNNKNLSFADVDDDDDMMNRQNGKIVSENEETKTDRLLRQFMTCLDTLIRSSQAATDIYAKDEVRSAIVAIAPKLRSSAAAMTWLKTVERIVQYGGGRRGIQIFANSEEVCSALASLSIFITSSSYTAYEWLIIVQNLMEYDESTRKIFANRESIRRAIIHKTRGVLIGASFEVFCQIVYSFVSFQDCAFAHSFFGHGKEGEKFADNLLGGLVDNCPDSLGEIVHRTFTDLLLLLWEASETAKRNFLEESGRLNILKTCFCELATKNRIIGEGPVAGWMKLIKVAASHVNSTTTTTASSASKNFSNNSNNTQSKKSTTTNNDVFGDAVATKAFIGISNQAIFSRDTATSWLETVAQILISSPERNNNNNSKNNNNQNGYDDDDDSGNNHSNNNNNKDDSKMTPRERFLTSKPMIVAILKVFAVSEGRQPSSQQQQKQAAEDEQRKQRQEKSKKMNGELEAEYNALVAAAGGFGKPKDSENNNNSATATNAAMPIDHSSVSSSRSANVSRMMLDVQAAQEAFIRRQGPEAFDPKTILAEQRKEKERELQEKKIKEERAQFKTTKAKYDRSELTSDEREIFERRLQQKEIERQKRLDEGLPVDDDEKEGEE